MRSTIERAAWRTTSRSWVDFERETSIPVGTWITKVVGDQGPGVVGPDDHDGPFAAQFVISVEVGAVHAGGRFRFEIFADSDDHRAASC